MRWLTTSPNAVSIATERTMPHISDEAVVLTRLDYSESSQVLAIFSRAFGKIRVIGKGTRRSTKTQFKPGIDLLEVGDVVLSVRHVGQTALATLTEWKQRRAFIGLRDRLDRLCAAQYAADIAAQLTEDWDPHAGIYDALIETFAGLSDSTEVLAETVAFQRTLLGEVGLTPILDRCVACGCGPDAAHDVYFSSFEGGLICRDCEPARVEKRLVTVALDALVRGRATSASEVAGVFDLFNYHISHAMGRAPAAEDSLSKIARRSRVTGR
jgi:DNA repair protein RecO (recombination protein O)